jgi:hypothetical protein
MTREEAIVAVKALPTGLHQQTAKDKEVIRSIVKEFGVDGCNLRSRCPNCWQDAVLILRNFFGISSTEDPGEDGSIGRWKFVGTTSMWWRGNIIDATTPEDVVDEFVKYHPQFFEAVGKEGGK